MATATKKTRTTTAKKAPVANGRPAGVKTRSTTRSSKSKATTKANGSKTITRYVKSNPGLTSKLFLAIGGAFVIRTFDGIIMRFIPALSAPIMVLGKAGAGWAVGRYAKRYLGVWAEILEYGLYVSAALTAYDAWVGPVINPYLGVGMAPQVTGAENITSTDGQIGRRLFLNDGNVLDVFPEASNTEPAWAN